MALAALQAVDLGWTVWSPAYGDEHLDHLGVPRALRSALPVIKGAAVVALCVTRRRPRARAAVGAALVGYYAAAVTFHRAAGDPLVTAAPAAALACLAASLV